MVYHLIEIIRIDRDVDGFWIPPTSSFSVPYRWIWQNEPKFGGFRNGLCFGSALAVPHGRSAGSIGGCSEPLSCKSWRGLDGIVDDVPDQRRADGAATATASVQTLEIRSGGRIRDVAFGRRNGGGGADRDAHGVGDNRQYGQERDREAVLGTLVGLVVVVRSWLDASTFAEFNEFRPGNICASKVGFTLGPNRVR